MRILKFSLQEKHVKEKQVQHWKTFISLQEKLKSKQAEVCELHFFMTSMLFIFCVNLIF